MAVQVTLSDLTAKVNAGWKKQALAEHYGLPMAQMTKLLQQAGLKIRKFHNAKFELINDSEGTSINHTVTQEDLTENPELVDFDVQEGEQITLTNPIEVEDNATPGQW